uniref:hypothetical protein n=1 Tax=Stappia sp. TaxID=1870903 RepID=UPI003BAB2746
MSVTKPGTDWTPLGETRLDTGSARVSQFARALGQEERDAVPATFAATILSDPALTGPVLALAQARGAAVVHQAQEFRYHSDLQPDMRYEVKLEWLQEPGREDRVAVRGLVRDETGDLLQEFRADIVFFENRGTHDGTGAQG